MIPHHRLSSLYVDQLIFSFQSVGMRLDEKRRSSECDGKHGSERYFRCPQGFGVFLSIEEVEVVTKGTEKDSAAALENCKLVFEAPADGGPPMDLDKSLNQLFELSSVKAQLKKVRQFVQVQQRRIESARAQNPDGISADIGVKPITFLFRGNLGTGKTTIARKLTHLLKDLGVVSRGHLIETSRKELTASYGEGDKTVGKVWKAAQGGVLLIEDIGNGSDDKVGKCWWGKVCAMCG